VEKKYSEKIKTTKQNHLYCYNKFECRQAASLLANKQPTNQPTSQPLKRKYNNIICKKNKEMKKNSKL